MDPKPFFETMNQNKPKSKKYNENDEINDRLRIPLLLLQHNIQLNGYYDSRIRSLLKTIILYFNNYLDWNTQFISNEYSFGIILHVLLKKKAAKSSSSKWKKWAKIGAAGIIGGTLIAVTGGVAAPAIAAGLGAIGLSAFGGFLITTAGTTTLYILFGAAGAGLASKKMHRTIGMFPHYM